MGYPNGCRTLLRFHTSKLLNTSTTTHTLAPNASNMIKWLSAVTARLPCADHNVIPATDRWQTHHNSLVRCSDEMLRSSSLRVGIGSDAGSASGARTGGSRKI